jgi:hypothetical protein
VARYGFTFEQYDDWVQIAFDAVELYVDSLMNH